MLDFSSLKPVNKANTKEGHPRVQNWSFRFIKSETKKGVNGRFCVSNILWESMGLEQLGLKQFNNVVEGKVTEVYLAAVENDIATVLKRTDKLSEDGQKGRQFKSTLLEDACAQAGIIDPESMDNQFLDLVDAGEDEGVHYYQIVQGEGSVTEVGKAKTEGSEEGSEEAKEETAEAVAETDGKEDF